MQILQDRNEIATINPFRYRSYYYDEETNFYYLQTRYYDPVLGRFISADSIEYLSPETLGGLNLYAYCKNNAVNYRDINGYEPVWWNPFSWFDNVSNTGKIIIGAIAFVAAVALTAFTGGALAPLFISMGIGLAIGTVVGGLNAVANSNGDWSQFGKGAIDGFADSMLWGGLFSFAGATVRTVNVFKNGVSIGENMARVHLLSDSGQVAYEGMPGFKLIRAVRGENVARQMAIQHNKRFITRMMKLGVKITDFGIDVTRSYRSFFYLMETMVTNGYKYLSIL